MRVTILFNDSENHNIGCSHFDNETTGDNVVVTLAAFGNYAIDSVSFIGETKYVTLKK